MTQKAKSSGNFAWKGACLICKSIGSFCYTLFVLLLALGICILAYLTTLDEFPVPSLLLRELEEKAQAQGVALEISEIRLFPDGAILLEKPALRSLDFNARILEAGSAAIEIDLPSLIFGHLKINTISLSNARFITPAMLSPSGTPSTLVERVDIAATLHRRTVEINHLRGRLGKTRLTAEGKLPLSLFQPKKPQKPFELRTLLVEAMPKIWNARAQLEAAQNLTLHLTAHTDSDGQISADARLFTENIERDAWSVGPLAIDLHVDADRALSAQTRLNYIKNKTLDAHIPHLQARAQWKTLPTLQDFLPATSQASAATVTYQQHTAHDIALSAAAPPNQRLKAHATLRLADQPWDLHAKIDLATKAAEAQLDGQVSEAMVALASQIAKRDLTPLASLPIPPDVKINARTGPNFKLERADGLLDARSVVAQGAAFDRATASASFDGAQITIPDIRIQKDGQSGDIAIGYNLKSRFRRFLVEGQFHPGLLDDWFGAWWPDFWGNFQMRPDGFYILMDSQGTFGIPDSLRITGHAFANDFGIRGEPMEYFRTDMFILLHYFDIYNAELIREEGYARGHVQIDMDRDPRDQKEKLAGLWIDAASTLDPEIGKTILFEVKKEVTDILAPYTYQNFPYIYAKSESIRHKDTYLYDIDLDIRTETPLTYNQFPLQSLDTHVEIDNEKILIPRLKATFGNGELLAKADIYGEKLNFETTLKEADFGQALTSAVEYFESFEDAPPEGYDSASMMEYGGKIDLNFAGGGLVGDFQSYVGEGAFKVTQADLKKVQLFGFLSRALEGTPLQFSTLKFTNATGPIQAKKRYLLFPELKVEGPIAVINGSGFYDLEEESMDFKLKLFPFQKSKMPLTAITGIILTPFSSVLEIYMRGSLGDPKVGLFGPSRKIPEMGNGEEVPATEVQTNQQTPQSSPKSTRDF